MNKKKIAVIYDKKRDKYLLTCPYKFDEYVSNIFDATDFSYNMRNAHSKVEGNPNLEIHKCELTIEKIPNENMTNFGEIDGTY